MLIIIVSSEGMQLIDAICHTALQVLIYQISNNIEKLLARFYDKKSEAIFLENSA